MNTISIQGKKLTVNWYKSIEFEEEIEEIIDMGKVVIVLTMPQHGYVTENRIYGVIDGKIAWRVQDMMEYDVKCEPFLPDPYSGIDVYEKDSSLIVGTTAYGFRMLINPQNGKIVGEDGWTK